MEHARERKGRIEYTVAGFAVEWDETGIRIEVTDYHAKPLLLPWKEILALANAAGASEGAPERDR